MKRLVDSAVLCLLFLLMIPLSLFSQEKTLISPYIQLQYFKDQNKTSKLKSTLTYSFNRMEIPLAGMEISFSTGESGKGSLGTITTDNSGVAFLQLNDLADNPVDNTGAWKFLAEFQGNDTIEAAGAEISVRDVNLEMSLTEEDSIRTIRLNAFTTERDKKVPVSGEVVMVYVPRMFSMLPVGEATLDENGSASIEFPNDIPGDKESNITIISRFEEHPSFGNVEVMETKHWGGPVKTSVPVEHRALWTKTPPMWMIVTLSVLLTGVWGHYMFAIISLILIKRAGKKKETKKL